MTIRIIVTIIMRVIFTIIMEVTRKLSKYLFRARKQLSIYFDEACCSRARISAKLDKRDFFSKEYKHLLFPNIISSLKRLTSSNNKG